MSHPSDRSRGPAKGTGVPKPEPESKAHPLARPRPPAYVIVLWVSEQLRERLRRNNAALAQELQDRGRRRHGRKAGPKAELEAEP
jgi:hypothetical protein